MQQIVDLFKELQSTTNPDDMINPAEILFVISAHDHQLNEKGEIINHDGCSAVVGSGGRSEGLVNGLHHAISRNPGLEPIILDVAGDLVSRRAKNGFDHAIDNPFKRTLMKEITDRLTIMANDFLKYGDKTKGPDIDYMLLATVHDHAGDDYENDHKDCVSTLGHIGTHDGMAGLLLDFAAKEPAIADILVEVAGIIVYQQDRQKGKIVN